MVWTEMGGLPIPFGCGQCITPGRSRRLPGAQPIDPQSSHWAQLFVWTDA